MRTRLAGLPVLVVVLLAVVAPAAMSATTEGASRQIALEVYCYTTDIDVPQQQAAEQCDLLGEFGLVWEQTLEVLDAGGAVLTTVLPQVITAQNAAPYPADGAWRATEPVLPEGWSVIECPFGDVSDPTLTNGIATLEAENLPYVDRRHVVCYRLDEAPTPAPTATASPVASPTPSPAASPAPIPRPSRIDTGGGGTAG
jgi:hypothetical protein